MLDEYEDSNLSERDRKMLAFIVGILLKIDESIGSKLTEIDLNDRIQLENIACELDIYDLENDYFRY